MATPTSRSLAELRKLGYLAAVTERWNPHARIRQDLYGFIDLLAIKGRETLAIQACAGASHAARRTKILGHANAAKWLDAQTRTLEVWSWRKAKPRGKRATWTLRREEITAEMLQTLDP